MKTGKTGALQDNDFFATNLAVWKKAGSGDLSIKQLRSWRVPAL
jgi:hypothetical protein